MRKKILLIGYNYFPEPTGIGKYSGEMMQWLADHGHECTVITAYPYYPFWKVQEPYYQHRYQYLREEHLSKSGGRVIIHRCPMYVPNKPSGFKRMLVDFSFLGSALFKTLYLCFTQKFDFVVAVAPSFQFGLLGVLCKKIGSVKFMYHIHDMQIEAARDLKMVKSTLLLNVLLKIESYIFKKANIVSTVSEQMVEKIKIKANKEIILFPNWVDDHKFYPITNKEFLRTQFGFTLTDKIILYSGAIGEKQGLESIVCAAREFQQFSEVKFVICGSGPYKEKLMAQTESFNLNNVIFFPLQPIELFNEFLNVADLHLVIQKANASDLMMPSKLTTILAVGGLALITANQGSGLHDLVLKYSIGVLVDAEDQSALNEGIRYAISSDNRQIQRNARAYAIANLSIDTIMANFEKCFD